MKVSVSAIVAAVFSVAAVTISSAPANAALPENEHLVTLGCGVLNGRLVDVNVDDATGTVIGEPITDPDYSCAVQGAFDPVTGLVYYPMMGVSFVNDSFFSTDLDGNHVHIGDFTLDGVVVTSVSAIAINSVGTGYLIDDDENLYRLDLETGALALIGNAGVGSTDFDGFAFDRTDDTLYGVRQGGGTVYTFNLDTGAATDTGLDINAYVMGITFDDDGLMWVLTNEVLSELASFDVDTNTLTRIANTDGLSVDGVDYYTQSAVYYGIVTGGGNIDSGGSGGDGSDENGLASTGFDSTAALFFAGLSLVTGVVLQRRRAAA